MSEQNSSFANKSVVSDEIFRIVNIETNSWNATVGSGNRLPRTKLTLQNGRTTELQAIDWNSVLPFKAGTVVKVSGTLKEYRGQPQLTIQTIEKIESYDPAELLLTYPGDKHMLEEKLEDLIKSITDERLKSIAASLLDANTELGKKFRLAPAAPSAISHEPYIHGLMQHSIEVATTAGVLAAIASQYRPEYSKLNKSHIMFCGLLHDIAKTSSYEFGNNGIKFARPGRLSGHLIEGYAIVRDALYKHGGFSQEEIDNILHIIASHHGPDSDVPPRTIEAFIVHRADSLCSDLGSKFGFPHLG